METHQSNSGLLRKALLANALTSGACGVVCLLFSGLIARSVFAQPFVITGVGPAGIVLESGLVFLLFSVFTWHTSRQAMLSKIRVRIIILLDMIWVVGSAALVLLLPSFLSPLGFVVLLIGAGVTLLFAVAQILALATIYQGVSEVAVQIAGRYMTIAASLETRAHADRVWQVMIDQKRYADVADNLSHVDVLTGEGVGMIRECRDTKGKAWRETCTRWDEGRAFAYRVHTEAEDYPYPIAALSGEWSLNPIAGGTLVKMVFEVEAKPGLMNRLMFKVMAAPFAGLCDRLLRKWVQEMEGRTGATAEALAPQVPREQPAA